MSENRRNCAPLPAPVGSLGEKKRGIANDGCERASRCGITSERFGLFDENFLNDIGSDTIRTSDRRVRMRVTPCS